MMAGVEPVRSSGRGWIAAGVALMVAGAGALGVLALRDDDGDDPGRTSPPPTETTAVVAPTEDDGATTAPSAPRTPTTDAEGRPGDPARVPLDGFGEIAVRVRPAGAGEWLAWCLLAALDAPQRARGLMEVTDLQGYDGMAFVYDQDVEGAFWMRNTPTPLSIAWVAADGRVVSIADMAPCGDTSDCPIYPPGGPYRYAIEVFQGDLPSLGIIEGATVEVGGECAPLPADDA